MIRTGPSGGMKTSLRKRGKALRKPARKPAVQNAFPRQSGLDLIANYQDRICGLERTLATLREQVQTLNGRVLELTGAQNHFFEHFEDAPIGYVIHDRSGQIAEFNRAAAMLLGIVDRDGGTLSLAQFVSHDELGLWLDHMNYCMARLRVTSELNVVSRTGRTIPVQIATVGVAQPLSRPPRSFRSTIVDLSERRATEEALARTELSYQKLLDTIEGIVWEADAKTLDITLVNRYAERLLGYPLTEWMRPGFWENHVYVEDRERITHAIARAAASREDLRIDYRVLTAGREMLWLHDSITVLERDGRLKLLGVAIDVTEREHAQDRLRQAHDLLERRVAERTAKLRETVADLEAFSYSISHDMRAPLRAMQGYASLLEAMLGGEIKPQVLEYVHRIMAGAERLDALIRDVLNYSRVARAPLALKPIPLSGLVENILNDYPTLSKVREQIQVQQPLLPVVGHEAFVGQALSNLLTNAVKFVPPGRRPSVRVWTEEAHRNDPARTPEDNGHDWVRIWVEDNGLGISLQDQQRIFRIFERVNAGDKYEGTGIGLAIVQKAIERMGGRVGVQSRPGEGSKFWIELRGAST